MKKIGIIVLIIGLVGVALALGMDTSVATGHGDDRVHNIGLVSDRQNYLFVSIAFAIVGAVLLAIGVKNGPPQGPWNPIDASQQSRPCPYCAEQIKSQAVVCRFCGKDVEPTFGKSAGEIGSVTFTNRISENRYLIRTVVELKKHKQRYLIGGIAVAVIAISGVFIFWKSDAARFDEMCRAPDIWTVEICQHREGLTPERMRELIQSKDQLDAQVESVKSLRKELEAMKE